MSANATAGLVGSLAADAKGLDQLRAQSQRDPAKAVAGAAKQFEAMFLGMVLKSMRDATPQDGLFDSEQTKLYTSMFDQQIAQQMAAKGTGLAAALTRQLSQGLPKEKDAGAAAATTSSLQLSTLALAKLDLDNAAAVTGTRGTTAAPVFDVMPQSLDPEAQLDQLLSSLQQGAATGTAGAQATAASAGAGSAQKSEFVNRIWPHAAQAARALGVQPQFIVGQAALESGWGRGEIRGANGAATHNLFGIKAGAGWNGPSVEKTTTEYVNGVAMKTTAKFRVYGSYAEAFQDYAKLIGNNPRYAGAVGQGQDARAFARGLQRGGYATDPAYADKLVSVINGGTLRQSLAAAATPAALRVARG